MISTEDIRSICERSASMGQEVKVRDIAFVLLCRHFENPEIAYRAIFGADADSSAVDAYIRSEKTRLLKDMVKDYTKTLSVIEKSEMGLTFEENKEALIDMLMRIKTAVDSGELDMKDALRMEKDIRVALNDKFSVGDDSRQQQFVIVEPKFNHICEWTRKECFLQTKEYAKKHWRLYERDELMSEIRREYKLEKR